MSRTQVLTDEMWAQIEPLLPPLKGPMGRPRAPYRPLVEGAIFGLRTGVAWRDLPAEFGPWQTVWKRQYEFCNDGTWDKVPCSAVLAMRAPGWPPTAARRLPASASQDELLVVLSSSVQSVLRSEDAAALVQPADRRSGGRKSLSPADVSAPRSSDAESVAGHA